jgi:Family of unknown function (DUF6252)
MKRNLIKVVWIPILFYLYGCVKDNSHVQTPSPYFIEAEFNDTKRVITENSAFNFARFSAELNHNDNRWSIHILSDNVEQDTVCRGIWITFDYVPKVGRHYFNNSPLSFLPKSGLIGIYSYYNTIGNTWQTRYTKDGYVDVTEINRDEMKGTFTFNATTESITDTAIVAVTKGSFYLHNYGGSDYWPGP